MKDIQQKIKEIKKKKCRIIKNTENLIQQEFFFLHFKMLAFL